MAGLSEAIQKEAHTAFINISRHIGDHPFRQQRRAYQAWLKKYPPQIEALGLAETALDMRRHVTSWLITEATVAHRSIPIVMKLLRDMEVLGWFDFEQKVRDFGVICSYFARRMWCKQGLRLLLPIKREVQAELLRTGKPLWQTELRILERIEQRLHARRRQR